MISDRIEEYTTYWHQSYSFMLPTSSDTIAAALPLYIRIAVVEAASTFKLKSLPPSLAYVVLYAR